MLRLLRDTCEVVYDVACGYGGLKPEDYGEDVFTLKAFYLLGYGPSSVNYHIRAWNLKDIPLGNDDSVDIDTVDPEVLKKFEDWLFTVWYEKDKLMDKYYKTGTFAEAGNSKSRTVTADFKLKSSLEVVTPFVTLVSAFLILRLVVKGLWHLYCK